MRKAVFIAVAGLAVVLNALAQEKTKMTESSPAQVAQVQKQIELLKTQKGASPVLTIQEVGGDAIIQLARTIAQGKTNWSLNIAYYPSKAKPAKALTAVGMTLPQTWKEESFEAETAASFAVPESDLPKLPQFIHDLFTKFFKRAATYKIDCSIENL